MSSLPTQPSLPLQTKFKPAPTFEKLRLGTAPRATRKGIKRAAPASSEERVFKRQNPGLELFQTGSTPPSKALKEGSQDGFLPFEDDSAKSELFQSTSPNTVKTPLSTAILSTPETWQGSSQFNFNPPPSPRAFSLPNANQAGSEGQILQNTSVLSFALPLASLAEMASNARETSICQANNSAAAGKLNEISMIANCFENGIILEEEKEKAFKYYRYLATKGHPDAALIVAQAYEKGLLDQTINEKEAIVAYYIAFHAATPMQESLKLSAQQGFLRLNLNPVNESHVRERIAFQTKISQACSMAANQSTEEDIQRELGLLPEEISSYREIIFNSTADEFSKK